MSEQVNIYQQSADDSQMMVTVTAAALAHIEKHIAARGHGIGIRFGVEKAGCSGMKYVLDFVDTADPEDNAQQLAPGISIFINPYSLPFVNGVTIDYVKDGLNQHFRYTNPNEKNACGCGESFHV